MANLINPPELFFDFAAIRLYMGCPCEGGPEKHNIYHDLGKGHIQWLNILVIKKPVLHGLYTKHISCFIWGIPLGIHRGWQSPFSGWTDLRVAFIQSTRLAVPLGITCFVSGSCMVSKPKVCILNQTKQKDEFLARLLTCKPENSRLQEQWVLSCSQTKGFLGVKCWSYLAFSADWLPSDLLPYLDQDSWVRGTRKSRDDRNRIGFGG